jgi:subtilisin family serine protease
MKKTLVVVSSFILASCGGGGGGSSDGGGGTPYAPSPTITLSAEPALVLLNSTSTLTWSSTNSTDCSASWTNKTSSSGSEEVTISTAGDISYSITCNGDGGSSTKSVTVEGYRNSNGVVVDGYISGAEVFIDEDGNWILDSNEISTTSDNDGKFTLKYSNGNLVSIGGTDLDSQNLLDNFLITQKLTGYTEFKAITPVTSIAAFMNDPSDVNAALGIDPAIDVSIFDPVANKGDGGVNDYLYEKGNQLTVIAYALQNIANNLNTTTETTQDYFQSIAEVIDAEYAETESRVNIETEAFITKALDSVISKKTLTLDDTNKTNTITALTSILPVIQVKANDANTVAIFNFATSTFQSDAQAIASGSATSEVISSYLSDILNYVATDQSLVASELQPDINAIIDSVTTDEDTSIDINVLNNDSYLTTSSITVDIDSPSDGTAYISNNIVTYSPDDNFFGTDSIAYNITQGNKTSSSSISLVINSVNDIPTFDNLLSTYRVDENQTAVTSISASDIEEEELTISLGGEDQSSFNLSNENVLTFNESPDYETKSDYELVISVTDGIDTLDKSVSVKLNNLNDNSPIFSSTTFNADENQTAIGSVTATDADGDALTYSISGEELSITSNGILSFASAPDYETNTSFTATVTVTDGLTPVTQDITVNVNNLNDNSPIFSSSTTFNADENQTAIGSVTATDADGDALTFSISGEELSITSNGILSFASAPDYETNTSFTATVTVTDGLTPVTQDITVNVNNLNDNSPIFSSSESFSIEENKSVIGTVVAADADIGSSISYSIDNSVNQNIEVAIEANSNGSGNVYVISGVQKKSLVLQVGKTYSFAHSSEHPFRFSTTSDGTHGGGTEYTAGVDTSTDGTTLITVTSETPANLYYYCSVHAGMGADSTSSSSTSPVISIAPSGDLTFSPSPDFETMASFSAKVSASDGEVSTDQNIQVEIIDVDPEGPVFSSANSLNVDENQTAIGSVSATDPFASSVTYSMTGTDAESIELNTSSGLLTFKSAPDYETKTSYNIVITAIGSIANSDQELTININNLNDNEPVIASSATYSVDENQTAIASIVATDADGDTLTYSVTGTEMTISTTGVLSFTSAPDYEETTSYTATVSVTDGVNSKDQSITVNVNNLNDNVPTFTSEATFSAAENQTTIGTAAVTDADGDSISFSVSGSELAITSAGVITFASAPNYETKDSYSATVTANDGINETDQAITISIIDVNDAPVFTSSATLNGDENQTSIGSITGSDEDGNSLSFSVSGSELEITSAGVITFASAPNYETKSSYTATVSMSDSVVTTTQDITINVNDINDVPVANAAAYYLDLLPQDQSGGNITLAATDEDGDTLTYTIVSNGSHGTASFSSQDASETVSVSVAANNNGSGNVYVIDGTQRKSLSLNVGATYTFNHSDSHPFKFSTTSDGTHGGGAEYTSGVTTSSGSTVIEVTASTPTTLYYYCSIHSGMGASASMSNTNSNAGVTYQTSASTQSAQSETFTFKVNDGTVDSSEATISLDLRTDPLYKYQWHLNNTGQTNFATTGGTAGADLNVDTAIVSGITGSGVIVAVLDEGLELAHEDLVDNIVSGSYDFENSDQDPTSSNNDGDHGTSVAGLIASKGWNNKGGRGVAPNASLIGYNILESGSGTNGIYQIKAWGSNPPVSVNADIYNMSYGRGYGTDDNDDPKTTYALQSRLYTVYEDALKNGVENLRNGKGAIYIQSSGNEFSENSTDDCGTNLTCAEVLWDHKSTVPYIMQVGSLEANGAVSSYTTPGSALWISGFGGENGGNESIVDSQGYILTSGIYEAAMMTVDQSGCTNGYVGSNGGTPYINEFQNPSGHSENSSCNYTSTFNGTSSAAPTVSGVVALMLEANSDLTWRDVKHILATTADQVGSDTDYSYTYQGLVQYEWETNAAGYKFHNWYGFGKVDAAEAVSVASSYTANSRGTFASSGIKASGLINSSIAYPDTTTSTINVTKPSGSNDHVEFVRVTLKLDHAIPKSIGIRLQSPAGTVMNIMQPMTNVDTNPSDIYFDIGVNGFYGEIIEGDWIIGLNDYIDDSTNGTLIEWGIKVYGN